MTQENVAARVEAVARASYGRLLAILAASDGDIEFAEDCLGDAFVKALERWGERGVPLNPEAWLLTVARNRRRDLHGTAAWRLDIPLEDSVRLSEEAAADAPGIEDIPDRRLALMFVCAHPAIDPPARTPLMLQSLLGLDADRIAGAFALPAATLAQRLVRAKRRIRNARIPFVVPDRTQLSARLGPVLEAIYGAYAIDFAFAQSSTIDSSLAGEARFLAETLAELLPDEAEVLGLAALLSLSFARRSARGAIPEFVPLDEQDPSRWDSGAIATGEAYLNRAYALQRPGRFQLEAAIQSAHCARAASGVTDWGALRALYAELIAIAPTLGAEVAHAAAMARVRGAEAGLMALDAIRDPSAGRFQPAWATRAHLLVEAGRTDEAASAYSRAIALTPEPRLRRYLEQRRALIEASGRGQSA